MSELLDQQEYLSKNFAGLSLAGLELHETEFDGCTFSDCDLSDAVFNKCKFIDCSFVKCNLSNVKLEFSRFSDVMFDQCKLIGVDWTKASWPSFALNSPLKFTGSILNDCSFYGLESQEIVIEHCKAHDVDFREGNFSEASFVATDLTGCLFRNTNLSGADFSDATDYDIDVFANVVRRAKFCRYEAVRLLDSLEIELVD